MTQGSTETRDLPRGPQLSEDFRFIADASSRLASSLDYEETLRNVAELVVEHLCDYCMVYLRASDGTIQRVAATHKTPEGQVLLDQLRPIAIVDPEDIIGRVVTSKTSHLQPMVAVDQLAPVGSQAAEIRRQLNPTSFMISPLIAGGRSLGAILCACAHGTRSYTQKDVGLLEELGRRAGASIEHAQMYQRAKSEAEQRKRAETRLQQLIGSNLVAVCFTKLDGQVLEANDAFLQIIGYTREELESGKVNWKAVTPPEFIAVSEEAAEGLRSTGSFGPFEKEFQRRDGSRVPALLITTKLEDDPAEALTVVVDITERKRHEEAQQYLDVASKTLSSTLDYQKTLQNLADVLVPRLGDWCAVHLMEDGEPVRVGLAHVDPEMIRWAETVSDRYPVDMASETGMPKVLKTGEPEFYPVVSEEMLAATARDAEHLEYIKRVKIGGAMIVPLAARGEVIGALSFVSAQQGKYTKADLDLAIELGHRAAIAVDHARAFRTVEEQVEERTQELVAVNRELESFAYSVSHDLRSPLRSIMSSSMIVIEDYGDKIGEDGKSELNRGAAAAKRMSSIIDDLLQFSRLGRREMNRQDVNLSNLAAMIGRDVGLPPDVLEVEPDMQVNADPELLRVMLTNLIENSWKFTKERAEPKIRIGQENGAYFVKDNGVGFDEQFSEKLFVPFERLHNPQQYPGTGIGLANVKRIVTRHGGKIWAHGTVDQGAEFYFTLSNAKA